METMIKYNVLILTDNNRKHLTFNLNLSEISDMQTNAREANSPQRIIYEESYHSYEAAQSRLNELESYTRMQAERLIRRSNPNWLNIRLRPSQPQPQQTINPRPNHQPGAKFNPNVPKRTSERWKGMA